MRRILVIGALSPALVRSMHDAMIAYAVAETEYKTVNQSPRRDCQGPRDKWGRLK